MSRFNLYTLKLTGHFMRHKAKLVKLIIQQRLDAIIHGGFIADVSKAKSNIHQL